MTAAFSAIGWGVTAHLAAVVLLTIQACAGARLLDRLGIGAGLRTHERILFGWAAGFSLTTAVTMVLTLAGVLGPLSVSLLFLVLAAASWPVPREVAADCARVLRTLDVPTQLSVGLGVVALGLWVTPLLIETALPNSDWDSALYHLPLAERYLDGLLWGRDAYFPAFAFPGAVHLQYAALLSLGLEAAITPLNFWVTVLLLMTTVALARRVGGRNASLWASVVFSTTPLLWQLGVDARIDGFLCLTILLAAYALVGFVQDGRDVQLKLAAIALGAAVGCKYTALPFVLVILGVGFAFRVWGSTGARGLAGLFAACVLFVAVPNGAWLAANAAIHEDPLFPMLRGNYLVTDAGDRVHLARADEEPQEKEQEDDALREPRIAARLAAFEKRPVSAAPGHLFDLVDVYRNPDAYAVKPHHGIGVLLLLSLVLPLALPAKPERRRGALVLWGLSVGGYLLLGSQTNLVRYVAPVLPMLAACAAVVIVRIPWRGLRLAIALFGFALLVRDFQMEQRKLELLRPELALGSPTAWQDRDTHVQWLKQVGYNFTPPLAYAAEQINAMLADGRMPQNSRILMVGEGKGRLLDCESIPDSSWFAHRFVSELRNAGDDHDVLAARLRESGVTHVLYNRGYYDWVIGDTSTARSRIALATTHVEDFVDRHGRELYRGGGIQLFDIRRARGR